MSNRTMNTTVNTLFSQLKENPVNWALLAVFAYVVKSYTNSTQPAPMKAKHPEVLVFRNYTPLDLLPYNGKSKELNERILMGVNGSVYDVSRGRSFYGPDGPYANFGGRDASRGLAKHSFDSDMLTDPSGPIDKLEDLKADEWEALREWEQHFATKYLLVVLLPFDQLPDELQIKIFSYLTVKQLLKITKVCKRWYYLVYEGSLWQTLDTTPFYDIIPAEQILKLALASGTFLKVANFRGCIQLTSHMLRVLSKSCYNTEILCLKDCRGLSTPSIACFLKVSHQLRILDLSGLESIKNSTLTIIGQHLHHLEELNINWCRNITGEGIQELLQPQQQPQQQHTILSSLQILKLNGCKLLDEYTMQLIASSLPNLRQIYLASCASIKDNTLIEFLQHLSTPSSLTHLNLSHCIQLTDTSLRSLAKYCKRLIYLELAGCQGFSDIGLAHFISKLDPFLAYLDLEDVSTITGQTIKMLATHQPNLKRLCIANCTLIDDEPVQDLILKGSCQQLEHLELDGCSISDHCLEKIATYLSDQQQLLLLKKENQSPKNNNHQLNIISTSPDSVSTLPPLSLISSTSSSSSLSSSSLISPISIQSSTHIDSNNNSNNNNNYRERIGDNHIIPSPLLIHQQEQQQKINQEADNGNNTNNNNKQPLRKKLTIEVLDCTNITESGVRKALEISNGMLYIKSFYSWREEQQQWQDDMDEEEDDIQQRYHINPSRRFHPNATTTTTANRTHRHRHHRYSSTAGQSRSTGCIIL
ncbi:hypothetical protein BJ944DRAFT_290587 [Cunninghamella echinulata]|nr:hypothetical protein BJ944DRAFT_290587 [Cunninghamella echinulata]